MLNCLLALFFLPIYLPFKLLALLFGFKSDNSRGYDDGYDHRKVSYSDLKNKDYMKGYKEGASDRRFDFDMDILEDD